MKQKYLKIENVGVVSPECFSVLGASLADTCVDPSKKDLLLGKFGSGSKNSICVLLRNNLSPTIFTSNLKMEFSTKTNTISDEMSSKDIQRICIKYSGKDENGKTKNNTEVLAMTTDFGKFVWDATSLALREFVSNAIDFSIRAFGNWNSVEVEIVDESKVRAKAGSTRIFIPVNEDVMKFYLNIGKWFLHFSEPESIYKTVLPKKNRNHSDKQCSCIYRRGCFVREFSSSDEVSLFDYNLNDLALDEGRKCEDWTAKFYSGRALANCTDSKIIFTYLENLNKPFWEYTFDSYSMTDLDDESWCKGWNNVYGEDILVTSEYMERVKNKGYGVIVLPEKTFEILSKIKIKTHREILTKDESEGLTITEPSTDMVKTVNGICKFLERNGLNNGKGRPTVYSYTSIMDGGSIMFGFQRDESIYLKNDLGGSILFKVVLEELSHFYSQSSDLSRDFQNYLLDVIVALNTEMAEIET